MARPRAIVLRAPGTNCDEETADAWQRAGADGRDLARQPADRVAGRRSISFQILTIPGGFSYGDDLGAGRILATRLGTVLGDALRRFHDRGGLVLGICNGFQVLVRSGLLPGGPSPCAGDAGSQRLGPIRGPLGAAPASAGPLAVRHVLRADRAARRPRRGPIRDGRSCASANAWQVPARSSCSTPTSEGRPTQDYPANPNGSATPSRASATRRAGSSA